MLQRVPSHWGEFWFFWYLSLENQYWVYAYFIFRADFGDDFTDLSMHAHSFQSSDFPGFFSFYVPLLCYVLCPIPPEFLFKNISTHFDLREFLKLEHMWFAIDFISFLPVSVSPVRVGCRAGAIPVPPLATDHLISSQVDWYREAVWISIAQAL